jgi:hypothetical protein
MDFPIYLIIPYSCLLNESLNPSQVKVKQTHLYQTIRNWLFSNTPRGARASAIIYSIAETAKENGLNPNIYLHYLFEKLPNMDTNDELPYGQKPFQSSVMYLIRNNTKIPNY